MQPLAEPVTKLIDAFGQLPGIGPKTASRLAYFLLRSDAAIALNLATALQELKEKTLFCSVCHNIADQDPCAICANAQRDRTLICVVEEPLDVQAIERTREFHGLYHVLHGAISPADGIGPDDLKVAELLRRIQQSVQPASPEQAAASLLAQVHTSEVREIVLATNPNIEGEATAMYISRLLKPLGIRVTRLARGLPVGGDLEYADEVTLGRALAGRSEM
ncbi:MAG: recombination mediator RecR [Caldilineaceae bacterium]